MLDEKRLRVLYLVMALAVASTALFRGTVTVTGWNSLLEFDM